MSEIATIHIAVDAMGGDVGPEVTVAATKLALDEYADLVVHLVGDREQLHAFLLRCELLSHPRLQVVHASEQVLMDESPAQALRGKKDSSMRIAINLVKEKQVNACVSAGNTGALMATARFVLKTIPGIDRPALIGSMPSVDPERFTQMLDLGANVDATPEGLCQLVVMGSVYTQIIRGITQPRVALLNIGVEAIKGNEVVKATDELLQQYHEQIDYVGYVEGTDVFDTNRADVVVADGFVGNLILKSIEGTAFTMGHVIRAEFQRNWLNRLAAFCAYPVLKNIRKRLDPAEYNGASLLGLQGIVIKSHGSASVKGFYCALQKAYVQASRDVPALISDSIATVLVKEEA